MEKIKNYGKIFAAACFALLSCLALSPLCAKAAIVESGSCGDGVTWSLDDRYALTISGTGSMTDSFLSSDLPWYSYRSDIKTVAIENGVTSIGENAFCDLDSLTGVAIAESVTSIGEYAFLYCNHLTDVTIPNGVTSIGEKAFGNCRNLASVTLGSGVAHVGERVFEGCDQLTSIDVAPENRIYKSVDGVLFTKEGTMLLAYPAGKFGAYTIPNGVTSIGEYAFSCCDWLTDVTIPESVTSIGAWAFHSCERLTNASIPQSVRIIGEDAFEFCENMVGVEIGSGVTSIGKKAFFGCDNLAFIDVKEENRNYKSVDGVLFSKDETALISFPCGRGGTYEIPQGVTRIEDRAFAECAQLTGVTIPTGVKRIGEGTFDYCENLTNIVIPDGVSSIGYGAFYDCGRLTSVTIPKSMTSIESYAFEHCDSLSDVFYGGTKTEWKKIRIEKENACLTNAELHESAAPDEDGGGKSEKSEKSEKSRSGGIVRAALRAIPIVAIVLLFTGKKKKGAERTETPAKRVCPICGYVSDADRSFCSQCGKDLRD